MPAVNGAMSTSNPVAIHPRFGSEGVSPTKTMATRRTSIEPTEIRNDFRIPSQSVITPEKVSMMVTTDVKSPTMYPACTSLTPRSVERKSVAMVSIAK